MCNQNDTKQCQMNMWPNASMSSQMRGASASSLSTVDRSARMILRPGNAENALRCLLQSLMIGLSVGQGGLRKIVRYLLTGEPCMACCEFGNERTDWNLVRLLIDFAGPTHY